MEKNRVGDCLDYGLLYELQSEDVNSYVHLKTAILALYLEGYIEHAQIEKIKNCVEGRLYPVVVNRAYEKILRMIAGSLKKRMKFCNYAEMIENLNAHTIPEWLAAQMPTLYSALPEVVRKLNKVYYILWDGYECSLRCMDINKLELDGMLENEEFERELSRSYVHIWGVNRELGIVYLQPMHLKNVYVEYHTQFHQEHICHGVCLGMSGNVLLVEEEGNLVLKEGDAVKRIKKLEPTEKYEWRDNEIYVTPRVGDPALFKPYLIRRNGRKATISYEEAKSYLLEEIESAFSPFGRIYRKHGVDTWHKKHEICDEGVFTLQYFEDYLKKQERTNEKRNYKFYLFFAKVLRRYFEPDKDVLDYLYVILDASYKYQEHVINDGISEKLYWRMQELDASGELEKSIYDIKEFQQKLLTYVYWTNEKIKERKRYAVCFEKVGFFEFSENGFDCVTVSKDEAACVGSMVVMKGVSPKEGMVLYNYERDIYEIQYTRKLTRDEILEVIDKFELENTDFRILIESRIGT